MNVIIGIDPSLTGTGVAAAEGLHTITSKPGPNPSLVSRSARLNAIVRAIDDRTMTVDLVVIEAPSLAQKSQAGTLDRNGLWWLIVDRLHTKGIAVVEVTPSTLKKFATGKGNATKPDMRMALDQRAGLDCRDDNQVDAWWLRQVGLHLTDHPDRIALPQTHTIALAKVHSPLEVPF